MAEQAQVLKHQFFDDNGDPLNGGKLYTYLAGTDTPAATYTDQSGGTPNANPVILDSAGRCSLWVGTGSYKFVLKTSADVTLWTVDNVSVIGASDVPSLWAEHAVTEGQSATNLSGETVDFDDYSSADYDVEILRGTTIISNGKIAIQSLNGTARVVEGVMMANESHGVTFSVSQSGTVAQLKAAVASDGAGNGTIKLSRRLVPV